MSPQLHLPGPSSTPIPTSLTPPRGGALRGWRRVCPIWVYASMPDDALFAAAKAGQLATAQDLQAQLQRMLADPKSNLRSELRRTMAGGCASIETAQPDPKLYPGFQFGVGRLDEARGRPLLQRVREQEPTGRTAADRQLQLRRHQPGQALRFCRQWRETDLTRVTLVDAPARRVFSAWARLLLATSRGEPYLASGTRTMDPGRLDVRAAAAAAARTPSSCRRKTSSPPRPAATS